VLVLALVLALALVLVWGPVVLVLVWGRGRRLRLEMQVRLGACVHTRTALLMACVADDQRPQNAPCMSPLRRAASMLVCASCKTRRLRPQAGGCGMYVRRVLPVRHVL